MRGSCVALAVLYLAGGPPLAAPARGAIALDLAYVDQGAPAFARFRDFVDEVAAGNSGYGFSATDAAYMYRLTGGALYASLSIATVEAQVQAAEQAIAAAERPEIAFDSTAPSCKPTCPALPPTSAASALTSSTPSGSAFTPRPSPPRRPATTLSSPRSSPKRPSCGASSPPA